MGRPSNQVAINTLLNGVPVRLGVITTAGASTTNASTAAPFAIVGGSVLEVTADAACVVNVGASASNVYTSPVFGRPLAAGVPTRFMLRDTDTVVAVMGAVAVNVVILVMA